MRVERTQQVYGRFENAGLLTLLGATPGRVLDVGCGSGPNAAALRASGATHLVGIEPSLEAAALARPHYDTVATSVIEDVTLADLGGEPFDVIVIADVIEHLIDPWAALAKLRELAAPGARIAISTPNVRGLAVVLPLLRGRFDYDPAGGIHDATHLRWFTRSSLHDALRRSGWSPQYDGGSWYGGAKGHRLSRLTGRRLDGFLHWQLYVVATAAS